MHCSISQRGQRRHISHDKRKLRGSMQPRNEVLMIQTKYFETLSRSPESLGNGVSGLTRFAITQDDKHDWTSESQTYGGTCSVLPTVPWLPPLLRPQRKASLYLAHSEARHPSGKEVQRLGCMLMLTESARFRSGCRRRTFE